MKPDERQIVVVKKESRLATMKVMAPGKLLMPIL